MNPFVNTFINRLVARTAANGTLGITVVSFMNFILAANVGVVCDNILLFVIVGRTVRVIMWPVVSGGRSTFLLQFYASFDLHYERGATHAPRGAAGGFTGSYNLRWFYDHGDRGCRFVGYWARMFGHEGRTEGL